MKVLSVFLIVFGLTSSNAFADVYSFVKDFELVKIDVEEKTANITVRHKKVWGPTRFELIPNDACLETFPAQCSGTIVRLDSQGFSNKLVNTTFSVNLEDLYGYDRGAIVHVIAPNKDVEIQF